MCGIIGIYSAKGEVSASLAEAMMMSIFHRGPDDGGVWCQGPIAIGNRRLSILDLSAAGHQPMTFPEAGYHLVYNGEIFNFLELRAELEKIGYTFFSRTDTEVVLKAYHAWGDKAFARFRGMFAFALWDEPKRELILVRDQFGIKPLYYADCGSDFVFGSELKSMRLHPDFPLDVDVDSLAFYLSHLYIPEPRSIFRGAARLPAGHFMRINERGRMIGQYYDFPEVALPKRDYQETVQELIAVLEDSVQAHLVSDVPIGVFLSGGVDSSAIVALMRRAGVRDIKTFSIGFESEFKDYDERTHARRVADCFQTDHHELVVQPQIADYAEHGLIESFDEPFANAAAVISDYLSKFTRTEVKVALAGVGGDELFGGYPRYIGMEWLQRLGYIPGFSLRMADAVLGLMPFSADKANPFERARRYVTALRVPHDRQYEFVTSFLTDSVGQSLLRPEFAGNLGDSAYLPPLKSGSDPLLEKLLALDMTTYLPGDLLTYADRTSMHHSLEVRVPFCDIEVAKFSRTVASEDKIRRGELKFILKDAFRKIIPEEVLFRPKMGFAPPVGEWLTGPLRPMIHDILSPSALREQPFLDARAVETLISEFDAGRHQYGFILWTVLIFNLWYRKTVLSSSAVSVMG